MKQHMFVSSSDGALYDTRVPDWSKKPPVRPNYNWHHRTIKTANDFKATLRAGPWAWPGGYPLYFICNDGGSLCFKCAKLEARYIIESYKDTNDDWRVIGCEVNYENEIFCVHCSDKIESAYGEGK